jgi:flagellar hook-associated protein 2
VTTAVGGVTLTLLSEGASTVSVTADESGLGSAIKDFVSAYNTLADKLDTLTANAQGSTPGTLTSDPDVRTMALAFRRSLLANTALTGTYTALSQIGVTTGPVGSAKGTTNRLQFNEGKLKDALANDPTAVASLLNAATGAMKPFQDLVATWTATGGRIDKALDSITSTKKMLDAREAQMQSRLDTKQAALEKKFATLEANLAKLQTTSNALTQQVTQSNKSS